VHSPPPCGSTDTSRAVSHRHLQGLGPRTFAESARTTIAWVVAENPTKLSCRAVLRVPRLVFCTGAVLRLDGGVR